MPRQTHDRTRDHRGVDLASSIVLPYPIGHFPGGTNLTVVLRQLLESGPGATHTEIVLHDFGVGLEIVTDETGDWVYGTFPNADVPSLTRHAEIVVSDFGSGLEPVTDVNGDWLYGDFVGV